MVPQRYVVAIMVFLCLAVTMAIRASISIILTQMVYIPNINPYLSVASSNDEMICPIETSPIVDGETNKTNIGEISNDDRFQWNQQLQGIILSSFYWGYILTELPAGVLTQKISPKLLLLITVLMSAFVTALTPLAVSYGGAIGLIATRILIGFFHGPLHPCLTTIGIAWYPVDQRGRYCSLTFIGTNFGSTVATYFAGWLMESTHRWDTVFYYLAAAVFVWCILFAFLCYDQPHNNPFITQQEIDFLKSKIPDLLEDRSKSRSTPWKAILTSGPMLVLILSSALYSWGFYIVNTDLPKYLNDVMHVSVRKNGLYSSLPRILAIFISVGSGFTGDWMHEKRQISMTTIRKLFVALASLIPAVFLIAASYAGCNEILSVTFLTIAVGCHGFNAAGTILNLFDLAPNYVGALCGIGNTVTTTLGILAPYIVGILTPNALLSEWRLVFFITFILHIIKVIIFSIWGTAKVQKWNNPIDKDSVEIGNLKEANQ